MITRKLLAPDYLEDCPLLRFADHTLLTETLAKPYNCPEHIPGPGILTMLSGTGRYRLNDETLTLDYTKYIVIDRDSRLSIRFTQKETVPLMLFFRSATTAETLTKQKADFCWLERVHPMTPTLQERLNWLVGQKGSCSSFGALRADAIIRDILQDLIGEAQTACHTAETLQVARHSTRVQLYKRLSLTREWIHANYPAPLSLDTMAGIARLNSQHFLRMFRDCYGVTPHQYLIDVRLTSARQLLATTIEPVSTICRQTGFESFSSFSGLFRTRYGASPTAWRRQPTPSTHF